MSVVDDRIAAVTDLDGPIVAAVVAEKLVAELRETNPTALADWLDDNAAAFVRDRITERLRAVRATAVRRAGARAFADADATGDVTLGHFAVRYVVDEGNTQKRVADMRGDDHRFVADRYRASGRYDLMLAAFHRAVAKQVGPLTTAEVMTEQEYDALLQSITKNQRRAS